MESSTATSLIAPLILAVMMLGMGMSLQLADFRQIFIKPKAMLLGLSLQVLFLPLLGFCIAQVFALPPLLAVGLMILVACPGGPGSNLVSFISGGDSALSVSLTAISSLLSAISIPLIASMAVVYFAPELSVDVAIWGLSLKVFLLTVLPITLGMLINKYLPAFALASQGFVKWGSLVFLLLLIALIIIKKGSSFIELAATIGLPMVVLCLIAVTLSMVVAKGSGLAPRQTKTLAIEVGLQNGALAIIVANSLFHSPDMAIPAAVYSPVMLTMSALFIFTALFFRENGPVATAVG